MLYLGIFGLEFEKKNIVIFEINTLKLFQKQSFLRKEKSLNLGQIILIWVNLNWKLKQKKLFSHLKSAPSNSPNWKLWCKNENSSVWNRNALFWYFGLKFWKSCCHIWNQYPQICLTAMFSTKIKFLEFGDQKCLIWRVLVWNLKILLS